MTKHLIGSNLSELKSLELFDFNLNTVNDFYSFLKFYHITEYIVICDGERIYRFVRFLNSNYNIRFHLLNSQLDIQIGNKQLYPNFIRNMSSIKMNHQKHFSQETSSIKNELQLMLTGHYPLNIQENRIKHLYVESAELFEHIDNSVMKNCIINAVVFYDKSMIDTGSELFPILINFQRMKETVKSMNLIYRNEQEVLTFIHAFKTTGEVFNPQYTKGMLDYTSIMNIDRNNRLFYYNDGIYRDYHKKHLITNKFKADFYELVNYLSFKNTKIMTPLLRVYPMVLNISAILKEKRMYMITPYNAYFIKDCLTKHKNFNLIGLVIGEACYVYDIYKNKNYKVNNAFLLLLEFYLKEKMDSLDLQRYIPNKLESFKGTFYEFIKKIS
ncbi:hypothetical protein [Bacillus sp. JCM 19034]|uniref:hypothetical protein n=1 Tax=Bacillus sp. JCM 19034 TaxID=1481928 RepID=UPI0012E2D177|nr:hypothetical protein [Bacillus sp. JCM 19034]